MASLKNFTKNWTEKKRKLVKQIIDLKQFYRILYGDRKYRKGTQLYQN